MLFAATYILDLGVPLLQEYHNCYYLFVSYGLTLAWTLELIASALTVFICASVYTFF